ncbi:MAG: DEAD/DEAH box helicase [Candidatus Dormibacteria bacterium]
MRDFHPAVRVWFERRFPEGPTAAQARGWPEIAAGQSTLISAPTGSGKTLAGFLVAIDALYRAHAQGEAVRGRIQVVYVSPLKALAVDVHQNLEVPLQEIREVAAELGLEAPEITVALRTGDTPQGARAAMLRRPPNFLVTTPESLYLLLTAQRSREMLHDVRWLIVDEIHALARDRRGTHLALSLERLEHLSGTGLLRVGLSATQRPIATLAQLLVGMESDGRPRPCRVVDLGHQRPLELRLELPEEELGAVLTNEQLQDLVRRIAGHVRQHKTTLVFVNTRRMSERLAHQLAAELGEEAVASHHGSLSKERRALVEDRLRAGRLRALVATASLELGIDIGPVELVCQLGSPRSLATMLQRAGRAGHSRRGVARACLYPTSRDELVECLALLAGLRRGELDAVRPPVLASDILAQQLVAECAAETWDEEALFALVRRAWPYAQLEKSRFQEVVELVSEGVETGRGRRGAFLSRDLIQGRLRGRRGARLAALTGGGAIPETGDYRVLAEPDDTLVGSVNEDWAVESMAGDVFLLGSTSWRILQVAPGVVRVADAQGQPPSLPFWLGEAPGRTSELSEEVSRLRQGVEARLRKGGREAAVSWVSEGCGVDREVAAEAVSYLAAGLEALGALPTQEHLILERFFDESGGMQLVVHAPFGSRVNKALGLALRKRFCATFDFELQAAASEDAVLLSLGPQHSFPLEDVPRFLSSSTLEEVLRRAALLSPLFQVRWRWNLNRALIVPRYRGGRRNPPPIQRMEADDVLAAVFPALVACQNENPQGPMVIPEHLLVRQTLDDCLFEAMDLEGLRRLVGAIEGGRVRVSCRDTTEASVLAHEIVNGRPYTFLDDAPLEERRSRAVSLRRGLPLEARDLGRLDPGAILRVRQEAEPDPRDADELCDLLRTLVVLRPVADWQGWHRELAEAGRATTVAVKGTHVWCAVEARPQVERLFPEARFQPDRALPAGSASAAPVPEAEAVAGQALAGHLDILGPVALPVLVERTGLSANQARAGLALLEAKGFCLRGLYDPAIPEEQWCSRRLLIRIHRYTQERLRGEIEPVTPQDLMRFLLRWQRVAPGTQREGRQGLAATISQLQGFEAPLPCWEPDLLQSRVRGYLPTWLDQLCLSGDVAWGRLRPRPGRPAGTQDRSPGFASRSVPVTLVNRSELGWLLQGLRGDSQACDPPPGAALDVLEVLRQRGAVFATDLGHLTGRLPSEVEVGLFEDLGRGLVSADGFQAARSLLAPGWSLRHSRRPWGQGRGVAPANAGGRWALLPDPLPVEDQDQLADAVAEQLLTRWGVVCRDLWEKEDWAISWREVVWALRRMEARGTVRGGRFVTGLAGEQYALEEAVSLLRQVRRQERTGELVRLSAVDPLNLLGVVLPGSRLPAVRGHSFVLRDGLQVNLEPSMPQLAAVGGG